MNQSNSRLFLERITAIKKKIVTMGICEWFEWKKLTGKTSQSEVCSQDTAPFFWREAHWGEAANIIILKSQNIENFISLIKNSLVLYKLYFNRKGHFLRINAYGKHVTIYTFSFCTFPFCWGFPKPRDNNMEK